MEEMDDDALMYALEKAQGISHSKREPSLDDVDEEGDDPLEVALMSVEDPSEKKKESFFYKKDGKIYDQDNNLVEIRDRDAQSYFDDEGNPVDLNELFSGMVLNPEPPNYVDKGSGNEFYKTPQDSRIFREQEAQEKVERMATVNRAFLREVEGFETKGYVPEDKKTGAVIGNSGVTIASGFDLGQHSVSEIKALGLPKDLEARLLPYSGLKKTAAQNKLKAVPLRVSVDEAKLINRIVKNNKIAKVEEEFNKVSTTAFESLPEQWQTVIASLAFQYGSLKSKTPTFWKQVTQGDWKGAHANLSDFGDKYKTRRTKEANLVSKFLDWDKD